MQDDVGVSYNTVNPEALRPIGHEVPVSCSLCRVYLSGTGEISDGRGVLRGVCRYYRKSVLRQYPAWWRTARCSTITRR